MSQSTGSRTYGKAHDPAKWPVGRPVSEKGFPLTPHISGKWMKKIHGTIHYFGNWARREDGKLKRIDGDGRADALLLYQRQKADLEAGRKPRVRSANEPVDESSTLKSLLNKFMTSKKERVVSGELSERSFRQYLGTCELIAEEFGRNRDVADIGVDDFRALRGTMVRKGWGPVTLGNAIVRVRSVFNFAYEDGLIEKKPRLKEVFSKPSKKVIAIAREKKGEMMFEPDQVRAMLDRCNDPAFRAMILLGVNCGFGVMDVATMPRRVLNLDSGWVTFARTKNGNARRCWLWPETVAAIRDALAVRPKPVNEADDEIVFLLPSGERWWRLTEKSQTNNVTHRCGTLLTELGIKRKGLNFYSLRRTHRTVSDEALDPVASDLIMGHVDSTMGAVYRQRVADARLVAVAEHVRKWLFGDAVTANAKQAK